MEDICVIGYPSHIGGADTELDHQIHVWQAIGLKVHLLHTGPLDENLRAMKMEERGCIVHTPCDWGACKGMHVISYCNGEFLKSLEAIKLYARSTTFVNCMTWLFDQEKEMHRRGLIDVFLYQTDHAREKVGLDHEPGHLRSGTGASSSCKAFDVRWLRSFPRCRLWMEWPNL